MFINPANNQTDMIFRLFRVFYFAFFEKFLPIAKKFSIFIEIEKSFRVTFGILLIKFLEDIYETQTIG